MKKIRILALSLVVMGMVVPSIGGAADYSKWEDVLSSNDIVKVYVERMKNNTGNPEISEERSTEVVKNMFEKRISTKFNVVNSEKDADIIFRGEVEEYVWMEKAPVTDIYGAGALAMDLATRGGKNYARKIIKYTISSPSSEKVLRDGVTLVTIKRPGMPEEKSYDMMYERGGKMLARDVFRKGKRDSLRP
jgi:hypothetical protein